MALLRIWNEEQSRSSFMFGLWNVVTPIIELFNTVKWDPHVIAT
jgi:hypothetical protein